MNGQPDDMGADSVIASALSNRFQLESLEAANSTLVESNHKYPKWREWISRSVSARWNSLSWLGIGGCNNLLARGADLEMGVSQYPPRFDAFWP